jgi:hypothetical protein
LKKWITPLATFKDSGKAKWSIPSWSEKFEDKVYNDRDEFIAIAEGKDVPIYFFTYNIEMTQFIYTNLITSKD